MDAETLVMTSELLAAASGSCLNAEQKALIPNSLAILKNEHGFSKVYYWGKLQGLNGDYLIAQGLGESVGEKDTALNAGGEPTIAEFFESLKTIPKKSFRLGPDGVSWALLPAVTEEVQAKVKEWEEAIRSKGRVFTPLAGDPAFKYEFASKTGPPAAEGGEPTDEPKELLEDLRLACMVSEIDAACSVVPAGALVLSSSQSVMLNPYYRGLSLSAGLKLDSYLHLRKPTVLPSLPISDRALLQKSTQFLDPVSLDVPKGSWSLKHDPPNNLLVLRSLLFPGYVHFSTVGSPVYGSAYHGTGARNYDLPFML